MFDKNKLAEDSSETFFSDGFRYGNYGKKKADSIIKIYHDPVLPHLCRILFIGMLLVTAAMLIVDCNNFRLYGSDSEVLSLLYNLSVTGFGGITVFSAFLIPLSGLGIYQNKKRFWKSKAQIGITVVDGDTKERYSRALNRLNRPYKRYLFICTTGCLLFGLLYLILCSL